MKVLLADDDPVSRRLLQSYLEKWGHQVTAACDGAEAWRLFEAGEFRIVLSDWIMPEMDGLELIRRIRSTTGRGYVYTILVSSRSQKEDLVEGMEAGADDFVSAAAVSDGRRRATHARPPFAVGAGGQRTLSAVGPEPDLERTTRPRSLHLSAPSASSLPSLILAGRARGITGS
jgi:CheY-like chemotaxis protein